MSESDVMELLLDLIKKGNEDVNEAFFIIESIFGDVITAIVTSLRGMFVAAENHEYMIADFSAIEAVVLAWLAEEKWKVEAFNVINSGQKYNGSDDIYCATASKIFQKTVTKKEDKSERQVGKTCELAFGYQGGVGAWRNFDSSDTYTDEQVDSFKNQWRDQHPEIVRLWRGINDAAINAVKNHGKVYSYKSIAYQTVVDNAGLWLTCILPNGRRLWYYDPKVTWQETPWGKKPSLQYQGRDNKKSGVWGIVRAYGGLLVENIVQAISRDLMVQSIIRVEKAGYPVLLTVHDEIIAEVLKGYGSQEEFEHIMANPVPVWAQGCPVGVDGYTAIRYRKG